MIHISPSIAILAILSPIISLAQSFENQNFIQDDHTSNWEAFHMAEEHQIDIFDKASFFSLHDFDGNDYWDRSEVLKTYGMDDPSAKDVPETKKNEIIRVIHELMDKNADNLIDKSEYLAYQGSLPDFGLGSGHHWDMETEYEIHHWRKFHNENTKEEDLKHPEDIEHFRLHDQFQDEIEAQAVMDQLVIVESNIPAKFKIERKKTK